MPRYITPEKIDFRLPYFEDENGDALVSLRAVKQCIDMTPAEDVVPRVELDAMRGAANSYKMHYENLAREIFAEIRNIAKTMGYPEEMLLDGTVINRPLDGLYLSAEDLEYLENKYLEEKTDGK